MNVPSHVAYQQEQSRGAFLRKLSYYLAGIAIGFAMLGMFSQMKKSNAVRKAQAQAAAAAEAAKQPSIFPPAPGEAAATTSTPLPSSAETKTPAAPN